MKRVICNLFALLAIASLGAGINNAMAQPVEFKTGDTLSHYLSVCLEKKDAIEIVQTAVRDGPEAAEKLWQSKDKCANGNIIGPVVGKSVYTDTLKGDKTPTHVVEIVLHGEVVGYFITSAPVNKPQRNT